MYIYPCIDAYKLLELTPHRKQQNHIHNIQSKVLYPQQGQRQQQSRVPVVQHPQCLIRLWHLVSSSLIL